MSLRGRKRKYPSNFPIHWISSDSSDSSDDDNVGDLNEARELHDGHQEQVLYIQGEYPPEVRAHHEAHGEHGVTIAPQNLNLDNYPGDDEQDDEQENVDNFDHGNGVEQGDPGNHYNLGQQSSEENEGIVYLKKCKLKKRKKKSQKKQKKAHNFF